MTELSLQTLQENIQAVKSRIEQAAKRSGRRLQDIHIVAASKMNDAATVQAVIANGITHIGENRVQELLGKYDENAYDGASLHFIGNLQSNKVKYLLGKVALIQSVGSEKLGRYIAKEAEKQGICQDILLEVNIGGESTKGGMSPEALTPTIAALCTLPGIRIRGLMTIPPISHERGENLSYLERMRQLFIDTQQKKYDNVTMDYLSMGMSGDYEDAILCGSNMVRIGSSIFGMRPYQR